MVPNFPLSGRLLKSILNVEDLGKINIVLWHLFDEWVVVSMIILDFLTAMWMVSFYSHMILLSTSADTQLFVFLK